MVSTVESLCLPKSRFRLFSLCNSLLQSIQKIVFSFALGCSYHSLPFRLQLKYQKYPYWSPSSEESQENKITTHQQHGPCCCTRAPVLFLCSWARKITLHAS